MSTMRAQAWPKFILPVHALLLLLLVWGSACSTLIERRTLPRDGSKPAKPDAQIDAESPTPDFISRHDYFRFEPLGLPESAAPEADETTGELPYIDLSWNPVLRIRLFSQQPAQSLQIRPHEGQLTVQTGDAPPFSLHPQSTHLQLEASGSTVILTIGDRQLRLQQAELHNSANGLSRVIHPALDWRYYRGSLRITAENGQLSVVNYVSLEDYVGSVVGSEMNFTNPEALKVQAVISRTYALWNSRTPGPDYDLNDSVLNQVYLGELIQSPRFRQAALSTAGEVLSWSGELILAAYHSTCGGRTVANETVWSGGPLPWLRGTEDLASCSASPHYRWRFEVPKTELHQKFNAAAIRVENGNGEHRASTVYLERGGQTESLSANAFRLRFNQRYGTLALRSTHFRLEEAAETYIFEGRGLGHGIGLCQWGALGKAEAGWNYRDILRFYYNGVIPGRLPGTP
ncbi:MAG: SpoIID/LytB domain-containing protein [Balneolales bacterium]|nr:SpoIID/LytB domain-containing protein [Balneolales bacterium]